MTTPATSIPAQPLFYRPVHWHRPLLWLGLVMAALALFCLVGLFVDGRQSLGVGIWLKPLKFAISTAVYSFTWSWLIGQLDRGRRTAWWAGTVSAGLLAVELAIIVAAAATGTTSHFNVSTPLATALWAIMALSISVLWVLTLVVSIVLFRSRLGDAARSLAIRSGAVLALVGMSLGFLMTGPTAQQLDDWQGIAGAHAVGVPDGGPGLPLLGWSTVAGDLRIPHFVGMHALQAIPIVLILLELLSRRIRLLRDPRTRLRLVAITVGTYSAALILLTWQALRGQSIVQPDAATLLAAGVIALVAGVTTAVVLLRSRLIRLEARALAP